MSEKEEQLTKLFSQLPGPLQEKMLDRMAGAADALDVMAAGQDGGEPGQSGNG